MKLPLRHLSVRVPWHDNNWNGQICKDPRNNASCMFLPRIQSKDVDFEEDHHCCNFTEIKKKDEEGDIKYPPCLAEKVTFMSEEDVVKYSKHPYTEYNEPQYQHYKKSKLKYPGHSFSVIPYNWMLKDKKTKANAIAEKYKLNYNPEIEPKLKFKDQWVQHYDNQRELLDTFISAVEKNKSLVFIYAKNIPLIENIDRVLIGVGRVTEIGSLTEYSYSVKNPPFRSLLWERPVFHSIRDGFKDGFILPYKEVVEKNKVQPIDNIDYYIAYCPNFEEFSYGSEHVTHDSAIDSLISLRDALDHSGKFLGIDYTYQIDWINNELSNIWNMRGAFPGLGSVLSAMEVPEGNLIAWEIEKYIFEKDNGEPKTNPWDLVMNIFEDKAEWLRKDLQSQIGSTIRGTWKAMPEAKKKYLKLMSRLAINNEQANWLYPVQERKAFNENPYLFFERMVLTPFPVSFNVVDKAVFPDAKIQELFPLENPSLVTEAIDIRRVRSLVIESLEVASVQGHSVLTQSQVITFIINRQLEKPCRLTIDIMDYVEKFFSSEEENEVVRIILPETEGEKFYKLHRLQKIKEEITGEVSRRIKRGKRIPNQINWSSLIIQEFPIAENDPILKKEKQKRANAEKVAALKEISESRFTVLIGPAGTGKTKLLEIFCKQDEIKSTRILKLAPTGKARVKLGPDAQTVAQFLLDHDRYDIDTGRYFMDDEAKKFSTARTVIIDEASMLTEDQLAAVINTMVDVERLILVGDPRQLPPIGTGKPFIDIIQLLRPSVLGTENSVISKGFAELKEIFRQSNSDTDQPHERIDVRLSKWFSDSEIRKGDDIFDEIALNQKKEWDSLKLIQWYGVKELEEKLINELTTTLNFKNPEDQLEFDTSLGGVELKNKSLLPAYFNFESAKKIEEWQILSPVNPNGYGVKELNRMIQKKYHADTLELADNPPDFSLGKEFILNKLKRIPVSVGDDNLVYGDKVMNLKNTKWEGNWQKVYPYEKKSSSLKYFANGEIGIITGEFRSDYHYHEYFKKPKSERAKYYDPEVQITFSSQPGYSYQFKPSYFSSDNSSPKNKVRFDLAYAITVHKSQGSGFDKVFLILPNPCGLLSRELFYTALTRQQTKITIFHQGDFKDFKKYISDGWSETGRRMTDLFGLPSIRIIKEKYYDSNHVQISADGQFMISKSEVIIADHLYYNKVRYTYENPVTDNRGITIKPDFTIEARDLGIIFYWEHLGLLTDDDYRRKWNLKMEWYNNYGVKPYKDATLDDDKVLITTVDKPDGGIDSQEVMRIIQEVIIGK